MAALKAEFNKQKKRVLWYPGSLQKYQAFKNKFPGATELGTPMGDGRAVPTLLAEGLPPEAASTQTENWSPVLQQVNIPGGVGNIPEYLGAAAAFSNEKLFGNLAVSVIAPPSILARYKDAIDDLIGQLKYGNVVINGDGAHGYMCPRGVWGVQPGWSSVENI